MSAPYIGEIRAFGFHFAPYQWAYCDGQLVAISQNQALFSILGTTFGGNGTTNFALPNLQDAAPMHWGQGNGLTNRNIGETLGTPQVTLTSQQLPSHTHMVTVGEQSITQQGSPTPSATAWYGDSSPAPGYSNSATAPLQFSPKAVSPAGGSQPHQNLQPLLTLNFCISLFGIFPSRN